MLKSSLLSDVSLWSRVARQEVLETSWRERRGSTSPYKFQMPRLVHLTLLLDGVLCE